MDTLNTVQSCTTVQSTVLRRGSRISARGGRQGIDDLIWDGNGRFLTYANTDLQLFKMCIAILCLNGVEQPFKGHQCPFFLPLRRRDPRLRRGSLRPRGGRRTQRPPPWIRAWYSRATGYRNPVVATDIMRPMLCDRGLTTVRPWPCDRGCATGAWY